MNTKLVIFLISSLLLTQHSLGKAVIEENEASDETSIERALVTEIRAKLRKTESSDQSEASIEERVKFLVHIVLEFSEIAETSLNACKKMIEEVNTELSDTTDAAVKAKLTEMNTVIGKMDNLDSKEIESLIKWIQLVVELDDVLEKMNTTKIENPTTSDILIENSLKKHGLNEIEKETDNKLMVLCDEIVKDAEKYWNSLSAEKQSEHKEFSDWLKQFKEETDLEKKLNMLTTMFQLKDNELIDV